MGTILTLNQVNIGYQTPTGTVRAVCDASLTLSHGESLGIVGESGSGKSTLAMGILNLLPKNAQVLGEALFEDRGNLLAMERKDLNALRWKEISVVFQKAMNAFSPVHKIGDQIVDIFRVHEPKATQSEVYAIIQELFAVVNLSDRVLSLYPHQLSGGMLQRICISLSLIHRPKLVFFDEATTALDVVTQGQVLAEIGRLQQEFQVTGILITHDMSVVAETCDRVAVMYAGYIMEEGLVSTVLKNPRHPYTQGLIRSFPNLRGDRKTLTGIPGSLPDLKAEHPGCIFAPRCPKATAQCTAERPKTLAISENHRVRCHRMQEV